MPAPQRLPCLAVILATATAPFFSAAPSRQLRADGKDYAAAQIVATVTLQTQISPGPQGVPDALMDCPWSPLSCVPRWHLQTFQSFQVLLLLQPHESGSQQETNGTLKRFYLKVTCRQDGSSKRGQEEFRKPIRDTKQQREAVIALSLKGAGRGAGSQPPPTEPAGSPGEQVS